MSTQQATFLSGAQGAAPSSPPALLVSVRDLSEARTAIDAGCDLVDVKEPGRGPLGMADLDVLAAVVALSLGPEGGRQLPCSAALGDIGDWNDASTPVHLPGGLRYAKLGPAGLEWKNAAAAQRQPGDLDATRCEGTQRWRNAWQAAVRRFRPAPRPGGRTQRDSIAPAFDRLQWVAVAYADWARAGTPSPRSILDGAVQAGCCGFLIDTFVKDGRGLLDALTEVEIADLVARARHARMSVALAGSIGFDTLPAIVALRPHVIAVRGAACEGRDRTAAVSAESIRRLKSAIEQAARHRRTRAG